MSDGSENEENNVPDGENVLLTDVDYDDDFLTDNYYGLVCKMFHFGHIDLTI